MFYDEETLDFVAHGISVYCACLLGPDEDAHCRALFDFGELDGWLHNKVVCDVGCGAGGVLERLRQTYPDNIFIGATNSGLQLEIIRRKGLHPYLTDLDAPNLPPADLYIFTESIGHAKALTPVLLEVAKKLQPGGRVLIQDFEAADGARAPTWNYYAGPADEFLASARICGLRPAKLEFPKASTERYVAYWQISQYMQKRHGQPYATPARPMLLLLEHR